MSRAERRVAHEELGLLAAHDFLFFYFSSTPNLIYFVHKLILLANKRTWGRDWKVKSEIEEFMDLVLVHQTSSQNYPPRSISSNKETIIDSFAQKIGRITPRAMPWSFFPFFTIVKHFQIG